MDPNLREKILNLVEQYVGAGRPLFMGDPNVCVVGVINASNKTIKGTFESVAAEILGCTVGEVCALEAGFEHWGHEAVTSKHPEFWSLGEEIRIKYKPRRV